MGVELRLVSALFGLTLPALVFWAPPAAAQRRGGKAKTEALEVVLPFAVKFGELVVAAGTYRASVSRRGLGLAHPTTMVPVATVPVTISDSASNVTPATVEVKTGSGDSLEVIVRARNRVYRVSGVKTDPPPEAKRDVELASRQDAELGDITPEQKTERELIQDALRRRYLKDVKHCGDKAHKSRWKTDDRRFWNCVCPLAERWRLPKTQADLRVHAPIAKGKSGLSLTVTPKGRAKDCRVWAGREPPADEKQRPKAEATPPADAAAPPPPPSAPTPAAPTEAEPAPKESGGPS